MLIRFVGINLQFQTLETRVFSRAFFNAIGCGLAATAGECLGKLRDQSKLNGIQVDVIACTKVARF